MAFYAIGLFNETLVLDDNIRNYNAFLSKISDIYQIDITSLYLTSSGVLIHNGTNINLEQNYKIHIRVNGGKGGFGSMLRAIGAQIEKTTNKGACRDLSGRRMRDVDSEKALKEWIQKNQDVEKEKERKKLEKRDRYLNPGKHYIKDNDYISQRSNLEENIYDSLKQGLSSTSVTDTKTLKRKLDKDADEKINKIFKNDLDLTLSSDEDESKETHIISISNSESLIFQDVPCQIEENLELNLSKENKIVVLHHTQIEMLETMESKLAIKNDIKEIKLIEEIQKPMDLSLFKTMKEIENLGMDKLKQELKLRNIKCGGTLKERAKRLFDLILTN